MEPCSCHFEGSGVATDVFLAARLRHADVETASGSLDSKRIVSRLIRIDPQSESTFMQRLPCTFKAIDAHFRAATRDRKYCLRNRQGPAQIISRRGHAP
jgi:hypothetical protein